MTNDESLNVASKLAGLLSPARLTALRRAFSPHEVADQLEHVVPELYPRAGSYFSAVVATYFRDLPFTDARENRIALDPANRQRCILALQAGTGQQAPLAIHTYVALMVGLSIDEIANILLLAGVYTGVPNFFTALGTLASTLRLLDGLSGDLDARSVLDAIQQTWAAPERRTPVTDAATGASPNLRVA